CLTMNVASSTTQTLMPAAVSAASIRCSTPLMPHSPPSPQGGSHDLPRPRPRSPSDPPGRERRDDQLGGFSRQTSEADEAATDPAAGADSRGAGSEEAMTDRDRLLALLARVEAATGPDRGLDGQIARDVIGWLPYFDLEGDDILNWPDMGGHWHL